jgi:hypothetical protein
MKRIISGALIMVVLLSLFPNLAAQALNTNYITVSGKNSPVWNQPRSTGASKQISLLAPGTIVTIISIQINSSGNKWGKIADRVESYIFMGNLTTYKTPKWAPVVSQKYITTKANVVIYTQPSSYSAKARTIPASNTSITITETTKNTAGNTWGRTSDGDCIFMGDIKKIYSYNATKALAYAKDNVSTSKEPCAGFVSLSVQKGGIDTKYESGTGPCVRSISTAIGIEYSNMKDLVEKLPTLALNSSGYPTETANSNILKAGDVVFQWCFTCEISPHILICNGYDSKGNAIFYATNNELNNKPYNFKSNSQHSSKCSIGAKVISF